MMAPPSREEREACWTARDSYFQCIEGDPTGEKCGELMKSFEAACPARWVKYFDKKRIKDKRKEKILNDGAVYTDNK